MKKTNKKTTETSKKSEIQSAINELIKKKETLSQEILKIKKHYENVQVQYIATEGALQELIKLTK